MRKVKRAYREKAKSELPELMDLIKSEKRGTGMLLRKQVQSNRELFPRPVNPEWSKGRRRTFDDLFKE